MSLIKNIRDNAILRLHWRLFFPLIGLIWMIIGITIIHFVNHEKHRQKENLENRLLNVNNTVIAAYERGEDLQNTVDFIKLFTDNTTLDPLRITVYDGDGKMVADNPAKTIYLLDDNGNIRPELDDLWRNSGHATVKDMAYENTETMISSKTSADGRIHSLAALPYEGEVRAFLSYDPMVWIMIVLLGILSSVVAYFGVRVVCHNVYTLRDFAQAIASDNLTDDTDKWHFSNDELGDVSRNLVRLYNNKIHAEQEKTHHEHQIGINISHELNTPVSIVKGYLDTVLSDKDMPEELRHKFITRAQQNINRLASLVNDVSMVIRLGEGTDKIPVSKIDFSEFAGQIAADIKLGHVADNMEFEYDIPPSCYVKAHESLLTNALMNLAYNAGKHSGGKKISLRWLGETDGFHTFEFYDDGKGVPDEHLNRLFDMFYRVDSGRTRQSGGTGLGLPLVKRIITNFGGNITIENAAEGGLKFTFKLPSVH